MSLLFNMLSMFVIAFLPISKCLLISWLQPPSAVILETKKIKFIIVFILSHSIFHEVMGPDAMTLVFWTVSFKLAFSLSSFTFIKRLFSSSSFYRVLIAFLRASPLWPDYLLKRPTHGIGCNVWVLGDSHIQCIECSTFPFWLLFQMHNNEKDW